MSKDNCNGYVEAKKNGTNIDKDYLYVTMEYLSAAEGVLVGEESTYTLSLYYEQV